jgi:hypothetical protein
MKRFFQKSVIIKASMLSIITIGFYTFAFFFINNSEIEEISINLFYINIIGLILIFFVAFILYIGKPLENISREVKALLT